MGRPRLKFEGTRKGMLQVMECVGVHGTSPLYRTVCDCGTEKIYSSSVLRGATVSCGCHRKVLMSQLRHGHAAATKRSRPYKAWIAMRQRCSNPTNGSYPRYGGAGITVCEEWDKSFEAFLAHVGEAPTDKHTIDRIDTSKGYEPGNVQWLTQAEQQRKKQATRLDADKVKLIRESTIPQNALAKILGVSTSCVWAVKHGKAWADV